MPTSKSKFQNPKSQIAKIVIAIDGPAGAGKSTVAKRLAKELGLRYLDSGAMYRCVALLAKRKEIDAKDPERAAKLAEETTIEFQEAQIGQRVICNGEDVSEAIRTQIIGDIASVISVHSGVRRALVKKQQKIIAKGGAVLEGRDATTVIAPNADLKIFLTADLKTRAKRRFEEFEAKDPNISLEEVERQISERDKRDSTRADSPLIVAEDATVVDTSNLSVNEVVETLKALAAAKG